MLCTTKAIVLHQIKYKESSLILHLFTRDFGRISGIVSNVAGKQSSVRANLFQPLYLLEIQIYYKQGKDLHRIREAKLDYCYKTLPVNSKKSAVALFLAEVLYITLREEGQSKELFEFIHRSMVQFDSDNDDNPDFHLVFLMQLIKFLGFHPGGQGDSKNMFFDIKNAKYEPHPPAHSCYLNKQLTSYWSHFTGITEKPSIPISNALRRDLLEAIITFYRHHVEGFSGLKSYDILREVFN